MKKLLFTLAIALSVFSFGQKMTDPLAMIPEGTTLTLPKDYILPADSSIVILNTSGGENNGGSYSQVHVIFPSSHEWRLVKKGTRFTVEGFVYMHNLNAFKILLNKKDVFIYVTGIVRPMELKMDVVGNYFDMQFPPMKIYETDDYVAPRDTIIISPLLPGQIDSLKLLPIDTNKLAPKIPIQKK